MSEKNLLIVRFPVGKGQDVRKIVAKHNCLFHHKRWGRDGDCGKFIGDLSKPDSENEGSTIRFAYDVDEVRIEIEKLGASVTVLISEFAT